MLVLRPSLVGYNLPPSLPHPPSHLLPPLPPPPHTLPPTSCPPSPHPSHSPTHACSPIFLSMVVASCRYLDRVRLKNVQGHRRTTVMAWVEIITIVLQQMPVRSLVSFPDQSHSQTVHTHPVGKIRKERESGKWAYHFTPCYRNVSGTN